MEEQKELDKTVCDKCGASKKKEVEPELSLTGEPKGQDDEAEDKEEDEEDEEVDLASNKEKKGMCEDSNVFGSI